MVNVFRYKCLKGLSCLFHRLFQIVYRLHRHSVGFQNDEALADTCIGFIILKEPEKVFNVSTCGDNCAKWLLKIAEQENRTVNLCHLMDFGKKPFTIKVLNTNQIVHSMEDYKGIDIYRT